MRAQDRIGLIPIQIRTGHAVKQQACLCGTLTAFLQKFQNTVSVPKKPKESIHNIDFAVSVPKNQKYQNFQLLRGPDFYKIVCFLVFLVHLQQEPMFWMFLYCFGCFFGTLTAFCEFVCRNAVSVPKHQN